MRKFTFSQYTARKSRNYTHQKVFYLCFCVSGLIFCIPFFFEDHSLLRKWLVLTEPNERDLVRLLRIISCKIDVKHALSEQTIQSILNLLFTKLGSEAVHSWSRWNARFWWKSSSKPITRSWNKCIIQAWKPLTKRLNTLTRNLSHCMSTSHTDRTRFPNATRFSNFKNQIKPSRERNFATYVHQIAQIAQVFLKIREK